MRDFVPVPEGCCIRIEDNDDDGDGDAKGGPEPFDLVFRTRLQNTVSAARVMSYTHADRVDYYPDVKTTRHIPHNITILSRRSDTKTESPSNLTPPPGPLTGAGVQLINYPGVIRIIPNLPNLPNHLKPIDHHFGLGYVFVRFFNLSEGKSSPANIVRLYTAFRNAKTSCTISVNDFPYNITDRSYTDFCW